MPTSRGFSMLELLIVISLVGVLAGAGSAFYRGYSKTVELSSIAQVLSAEIRYAQARSMTGEGGFKWGVHAVNGATDYYEIFSTPTTYSDVAKVVVSTTGLLSGVEFSDPASNTTKDIIFDKISGKTTGTTVSLISEGVTQVVTITSVGAVY